MPDFFVDLHDVCDYFNSVAESLIRARTLREEFQRRQTLLSSRIKQKDFLLPPALTRQTLDIYAMELKARILLGLLEKEDIQDELHEDWLLAEVEQALRVAGASALATLFAPSV